MSSSGRIGARDRCKVQLGIPHRNDISSMEAMVQLDVGVDDGLYYRRNSGWSR